MTSPKSRSFPVASELLLERERTASTITRGPWSASLRGAELDDIAFDGELVLRSVRFVVRDQDWTTLPVIVDAVERTTGGLQLRGRVGSDGGDVMVWTLGIELGASTLSATVRAEVTTAFRRARVGLIVLQSPSLAGTRIVVGHPEGSTTTTVLPEQVSPHQPAIRIASLSWTGERVATRVDLSGDVFEMEDQRNWTDASFKTYSTPLSLPFPVALTVGDVVEQRVQLTCSRAEAGDGPDDPLAAALALGVESEADRVAAADPVSVEVRFGAALDSVLPAISTGVSTDADGGRAGAEIPPSIGAVLVELDPTRPEWSAILDRAVRQADGRPLDVRLVLGAGVEAEPVLARLRDDALPVARIGVFHRRTHLSESALLAAVAAVLDAIWPESARSPRPLIVGGTRAHFTELNRNHARLERWTGPLAFSVTPFMHDRGGHQLVESLGMQAVVVTDAVRIADGRPLHIGPVTLGARYNAVATSASVGAEIDEDLRDGFGAEHVTGATDERQSAEALGAWVVGSVAALAVPGVESLSYFEATGPRGVVAADGTLTGAGRALGWLAELSGLQRVAVEVGGVPLGAGAPVSAEGLAAVAAVDGSGEIVLVLGNLAASPTRVELAGPPVAHAVELAAGEVVRIVVTSPST